MRPFAYTTWAVVLLASTAGAQPPARKEPARYVASERASRVEARPPGIRLGLHKPREFALAPLSSSELAELAKPDPRLITGVHRRLPPEALTSGAWEITPEGTRVWRLAITSPESDGLRVEFRHFSVGKGKVWLHDGTQAAGPYRGRGSYGDGHFWSATVFSDSVILEYEPGPDATAETAPPFEIGAISHQAKAPLRSPAGRLKAASPQATSTDTADYCHLDPNCYPEWKSTMNMVAQLMYEEEGVKYLCSGALVATRDNSFKPYLLTAGHCIHSEEAARTLEVFWTYQTSSCGGAPPSGRDTSIKSSLGASLIGSGTIDEGDYSLVLLRDVPGGVTFAGWDTSDPPLTTELTGLHHPAGSWKRISFGERIADHTYLVAGTLAPGDKYLQVVWDKGRTEPGSSGSPLFSGPGVIVGSLSYGPVSPSLTACQINPSFDGYGRFSNVYTHLKDYFENLPAAGVAPDKTDLRFSVSGAAAPSGQSVRLITKSAGQIAYKLRADAPWVGLSATTGTLSAASPAQVTVTVDPSQFDRAGEYTTTVSVFSGAAPPEFINVTAVVSAKQSNVAVSITPNPVVQSFGQWSFTIRLSESAGLPTRVTAMKLNGTDYSSRIATWFGSDLVPAGGAIEAPLQGSGSFPRGPQYFEFWGIDESGARWYRVESVVFQ